MNSYRRRFGKSLLLVLPAVLAVFTTSCGNSSASGQAACKPPDLSLEKTSAVNKQITAAKGGWVVLKDGKGAVYFLPGSLDHDTTIVMTPVSAPAATSDIAEPGFELEDSGTGKPPQLKGPIEIDITQQAASEHDALFQYSSDGPQALDGSPVTDSAGVTVMTEFEPDSSNSCSMAFGLEKPAAQAATQTTPTTSNPWKRKQGPDQVSVDSDAISPATVSGKIGTWTFSSHLTMNATCSKPAGWSGAYSGTFNLSVKGSFQQAAGLPFSINMPIDVTATGNVIFTSTFPRDIPGLAPLLQQAAKDTGISQPDLYGQGYLYVNQSLGNFSASGFGPGASVGFSLQSSDGGKTWPMVVVIDPESSKVYVIWQLGTYVGTISGNLANSVSRKAITGTTSSTAMISTVTHPSRTATSADTGTSTSQ
ncbi:MAG: hypothetical protein M1309_06635 [Actinobacteria bacterium]|nr:hypothetical protein [Actinomycetota bacterium]